MIWSLPSKINNGDALPWQQAQVYLSKEKKVHQTSICLKEDDFLLILQILFFSCKLEVCQILIKYQLNWGCSKWFFSHMRQFTSLQRLTLFSDKWTFLQNLSFWGSTRKGCWKLCRLYAKKYLPWANTIKQRFTLGILFSACTWNKKNMNNSACFCFVINCFFLTAFALFPLSVHQTGKATYPCVSRTDV